MRLTKHDIEKYNRPETVAVISLYPKRGEVYSAGASGVASYTKNVVRDMKRPVVVLADELGRNNRYEENDSLVLRVWQRNHKRMWLQLVMVLRQLTQVSSLLIHFDFSMYGGMVNSGLILPFLAVARIMGFKPVVVSHHVIADVKPLSGQVGLGTGLTSWVKTVFYNITFKTFYRLLGLVTERIVVLEEPLKERLGAIIPDAKVIVIPHAVDEHIAIPTKQAARKRLGYNRDEWVVLFFGYVNWFKGADIFARAYASKAALLHKKARFVMAGGESPTLKDKVYYKQFYQGVVETVAKAKKMELTGYVPQDMIGDYFTAADLIVFPYREFMCASGVMAQAFAYKKPMIISKSLARMFAGSEMKNALKKVGLRLADITFTLDEQTMLEVTERVVENGLKAKMVRLATILSKERSFAKTAYLYENALTSRNPVRHVPEAKGVSFAYAVDK